MRKTLLLLLLTLIASGCQATTSTVELPVATEVADAPDTPDTEAAPTAEESAAASDPTPTVGPAATEDPRARVAAGSLTALLGAIANTPEGLDAVFLNDFAVGAANTGLVRPDGTDPEADREYRLNFSFAVYNDNLPDPEDTESAVPVGLHTPERPTRTT